MVGQRKSAFGLRCLNLRFVVGKALNYGTTDMICFWQFDPIRWIDHVRIVQTPLRLRLFRMQPGAADPRSTLIGR